MTKKVPQPSRIRRGLINCNVLLLSDLVYSISQVPKATIEGYTGEGSPPHLEMMITAASEKTTPPDLTVEAKLKGVRTEPNIIKFEKIAHNVVECVCQVFYHKIALNHWRARVAFFPKEYMYLEVIYLF